MNAAPIRGEWVGRKIDGRFPLIEWLGGTDSSGVFVTEIDGTSQIEAATARAPSRSEPQKAAIKLMPASAKAEDRLAGWAATSTLSHPHLVRILHFGRAEIDEAALVYVVTEFAEEMLAQILPERALTSGETREMLGPVLDALDYLHNKGYVHGHVKPTNILVVENEVKLSSDGLIARGKPSQELLSNDLYNAPEAGSGPVTPAADSWSLGVTLVEALTQQSPIWDAATDADAEVPASLPKPFDEIVRECLHADPARRCTVNDIRAMLEGKPRPVAQPASQVPLRPVPQAPQHPAPRPSQHMEKLADKPVSAKIPLVPLIAGFVLILAILIGLAMHSHKTETAPLQTETTQQAPAAEPDSHDATQRPGQQPATGASTKAEVIDRVLPDVPRGASSTIEGKVSVTVRVAVDPTGAVANAELESRGPSAYFARLALESARKWKFKPAQENGRAVASTWLLHYGFRRGGTEVTPVETAP